LRVALFASSFAETVRLSVVNVTNILWADFAPISLCQKLQNKTVIGEKLHKTFL